MSRRNEWLRGACLGVLTASLTGMAAAQSEPASPAAGSEVTEIVVSGIRAGLERGLDSKRGSDQFIDAVAAEDVGKLPADNLAESLQQVSGIQVKRTYGQGTSVEIRGLKQDRVEVDGRDLVSPYGRGQGQPVDSDYNPLSLYPSEVISKLEVIKLLAADQTDGSIGGTVNIVTRKPFDDKGLHLVMSGEGDYSDLAQKADGKISGLLSDTSSDGKWGFLINLVEQKNHIQEDSFNSNTGYLPLAPATGNNLPSGSGQPGFIISDMRYQRQTEARNTFGGTASVQWRPNSDWDVSADYMFSKYHSDRLRNWLALPMTNNLNSAAFTCAGCSYTFSPNGNVIAGTENSAINTNQEIAEIGSFLQSGGLNATWYHDHLTVKGQLGYSDANLTETQTFVRLTTNNNYLVGFNFLTPDIPSLSLPGSVPLGNGSLWHYTNVFDNYFRAFSYENSQRLDLDYAFDDSFITSVQVGGKGAQMVTGLDTDQNQLGVNVPTTGAGSPAAGSALYTVGSTSNLLGGLAPFATNYVLPVPLGGNTQFACVALLGSCTPQLPTPSASYRIHEDTTAEYIRANFASSLFGLHYSGNVGVRHTETDRTAASASLLKSGQNIPVSDSTDTSFWLPSGMVKVDVTDDFVVRLGGGKTIGLPDSSLLSPSVIVNGPGGVATAGNPSLKPFQAVQYDTSFEYYFGKSSAVTLGLFHKDVKAFLSTQAALEHVPGATNILAGSIYNGTDEFLVTRSVNGGDGEINGLELLYQQPFTFLPAPFDGFGMETNFSWIESSTPLTDTRTGGSLPIQGLSKDNLNLVAYYETDKFAARIAYNYRSKFLDSIANGAALYYTPYGTVDLSLRYMPTNALTFTFSIANLNDEQLRRYTTSPEAVNYVGEEGRRFSAGVMAKF